MLTLVLENLSVIGLLNCAEGLRVISRMFRICLLHTTGIRLLKLTKALGDTSFGVVLPYYFCDIKIRHVNKTLVDLLTM